MAFSENDGTILAIIAIIAVVLLAFVSSYNWAGGFTKHSNVVNGETITQYTFKEDNYVYNVSDVNMRFHTFVNQLNAKGVKYTETDEFSVPALRISTSNISYIYFENGHKTGKISYPANQHRSDNEIVIINNYRQNSQPYTRK